MYQPRGPPLSFSRPHRAPSNLGENTRANRADLNSTVAHHHLRNIHAHKSRRFASTRRRSRVCRGSKSVAEMIRSAALSVTRNAVAIMRSVARSGSPISPQKSRNFLLLMLSFGPVRTGPLSCRRTGGWKGCRRWERPRQSLRARSWRCFLRAGRRFRSTMQTPSERQPSGPLGRVRN